MGYGLKDSVHKINNSDYYLFFGFCAFIAGITCVGDEGFSRQVFYLFIGLPSFVVLIRKILFAETAPFISRQDIPFCLLMIFFFYCFASVFWSDLNLQGKADVVGRSYYLLFFLFAIFLLSSKTELINRLPLVFVFLTVFSLLLALIEGREDAGRLQGVGRIWISTQAGFFYCVASVLAAYFAYQARKPWQFWSWQIVSLYLLVGTLLTVSRTPMFINLLLLVFLPVYFTGFRKLKNVVALLFIIMLSVFFFTQFFPEKIDILVSKGLESARYKIWKAGFELFMNHPVFGVGIGVNEVIVVDYGRFQSDHHAHNLLLDHAVKLGLVGVLGFVALLVMAFYRGLKSRQHQPWLLMLIAYLLFSITGGRLVVDRIQPDWVVFYLPLVVLLSIPLGKTGAGGLSAKAKSFHSTAV